MTHPSSDHVTGIAELYRRELGRRFGAFLALELDQVDVTPSPRERASGLALRELYDARAAALAELLALHDRTPASTPGWTTLANLERLVLRADWCAAAAALVAWTRDQDAELATIGGAVLLGAILGEDLE